MIVTLPEVDGALRLVLVRFSGMVEVVVGGKLVVEVMLVV